MNESSVGPPDMSETLEAIRRGIRSMQTAQIVELRSLAAHGDMIEVEFSDRRESSGAVYRGRARLTGPSSESITMGDVPGPDEWAEYHVIFPIIEALVTTAAESSDGGWIDLPMV